MLSTLQEVLLFIEDKGKVELSDLKLWPSRQLRGTLGKLNKEGLVERKKENNQIVYVLTPKGHQYLDESLSPLKWRSSLFGQRWTAVTFEVSEANRNIRDRIRRTLKQLGFKSLKNGLWISPQDRLDEVEDRMERVNLLPSILAFRIDRLGKNKDAYFESTFELTSLNKRYSEFIAKTNKFLATIGREKNFSFEAKKLIFEYASIISADPNLEAKALPPDWKGNEAKATYQQLRTQIT